MKLQEQIDAMADEIHKAGCDLGILITDGSKCHDCRYLAERLVVKFDITVRPSPDTTFGVLVPS